MLTTRDRRLLADLLRSAARGRRLLSPAAVPAAGVLLAACTALIALLGILFADQSQPGRLDTAADNWIQSSLGGHPGVLSVLAGLGGPIPVTVMTLAVLVACLGTNRVRGALLAAVAVPVAAGTTEFLIKPLVDRTRFSTLSYPSGHTTGIAALAAVLAILLIGPLRPPLPLIVRVLLASADAVLAVAVATALVGLGKHYFTDTVAGAAVGISVVLLTALILDHLFARPEAQADGPQAAPASAQNEGHPHFSVARHGKLGFVATSGAEPMTSATPWKSLSAAAA